MTVQSRTKSRWYYTLWTIVKHAKCIWIWNVIIEKFCYMAHTWRPDNLGVLFLWKALKTVWHSLVTSIKHVSSWAMVLRRRAFLLVIHHVSFHSYICFTTEAIYMEISIFLQQDAFLKEYFLGSKYIITNENK